MAKVAVTEMYEKTWNPQEAYEKVAKTINNEWPDWKKKAYNETFAVSAHAQKIVISR